MFVSRNIVRMHDTDMAGIIFFAKQFRWAHDALEDWMYQEDLGFHSLFTGEEFAFVIVHCEADYLAPVQVGDPLEVRLHIAKVGKHSFTVQYDILRAGKELIGRCKTVHCTINPRTRAKLPLPDAFREKLLRYLRED
ncbi:MAG: acyl-CoA thioesterase [Chlamydiia bacterium]|nr:acyl-CoA thioesterase [Chlamydiia bacterium]